jgi:hypothetical protein
VTSGSGSLALPTLPGPAGAPAPAFPRGGLADETGHKRSGRPSASEASGAPRALRTPMAGRAQPDDRLPTARERSRADRGEADDPFAAPQQLGADRPLGARADAPMDPSELASLLNEALVEQARLHGIDLA